MPQTLGLLVACLAIAVIVSVPSPALAQDTLPSSVTRVEGQWTDSQRDDAIAYINRWMFAEGDAPATIADKRKKLREPLERPGATVDFQGQYSDRLAIALDGLDASENDLIRLNALICVAALQGVSGVDLATGALDDPHPAVQFWAASAAAQYAQRSSRADAPLLNPTQQRNMLAALRAVVGQERWPDIRQQMYITLARLDLPDARVTLIAALDAALARYVNDGASAALRAEATGLAQLSSVLLKRYVVERNAGGDIEPIKNELKALARSGYNFAQLVARDIKVLRNDEAGLPVAGDLINTVNRLLDQTLQVHGADQPGPAIARRLADGKYDEFAWQVGEWKPRLTGDPLNIPAAELALPQAAADGEQANAGQ